MSQDDREYFERRAEMEIELAAKATHGNVVRAHYELACAYLDKVHPAPDAERAAGDG
jgi:hypothetical protein